jgi:cytochrome P450
MENTDAGKFNLRDIAFLRDPHPDLRRLREQRAIHPCSGGYQWMLVRRDAIETAAEEAPLCKPKIAATLARLLQPEAYDAARNVIESYDREMLWLDPPEHTRQRRLVTKAFRPRAIDALRGRIEAIAEELIDRRAQEGRIELIADFAYPLTERVIAELLGIPDAGQPDFLRWNADLSAFRARPTHTADPLALARRAGTSHRELKALLLKLIDERRGAPGEDLLSALAQAEVDGERLGDDEIVVISIVLLRAGHHTTANLIASALYLLLQNPDQLERLRADRSLVVPTIEESLRLEPPVSVTSWEAASDCTIAGAEVRAGDQMIWSYAAANRDPKDFAHPDQFDIDRSPNPHMAFGLGIHYCLGAYLARTEAAIALNVLLDRLSEIAVDSETVEWQASVYRGLVALPLTFVPTARQSG